MPEHDLRWVSLVCFLEARTRWWLHCNLTHSKTGEKEKSSQPGQPLCVEEVALQLWPLKWMSSFHILNII